MKLATGFLSPTDDSSPREFEWDCLIVYDDSAHGAHAIAMLGHPRNTDLFEGLSAREMNMRALRNASAYGVGILGLVLTALTADTARAALPSLDGVSWHGPSTTLDALAGKTVVVLTYVTWCPKCNEWSPNLFDQLRTAVEDKPVESETPPAVEV